MKRSSRIAAVIGILAILTMPPFSVVTASDVSGSNEELSACLDDGDRGLAVLFLVDTSQSLKKKDPRNERVEALQGALRALDSVADSRQIHVEFLDFGSKAERSFPDLSPWSDYDEVKSGLPERVKEYEDRNTAEDTDYADALQKAAERFDDAPDGECKLLAWFTDGALDIDFQGTPKTLDWATPPFEVNSEADQDEGKKKAKEAICDPEGFADNLRPPVDGDLTDGAFIAAVPIVDGNEKDFDFLNRVVTNPDRDCGRTASGSMVLTEDFDQLTSALIRGVDPAPSAATVDDVPLQSEERCSAPLNPDSLGAFSLPSSVESIRMRTETPSSEVVPVLLGPFGDDVDPLRFDKPGTNDVADGAVVSISELSPLMTNVDFVLPKTVGAWSGVWELRFCAKNPDQIPGSGTVEVLEVAGTVGAQLRTGNPVRRGRSGTAIIELVNRDQQPLRSDALGATEWLMTASDEIELRNETLQDDGTIRSEFDVPLDFEPDELKLDLKLEPEVEVFPRGKMWPIDDDLEQFTISIKDLPKYPLIDPPSAFGELNQNNLSVVANVRAEAQGPESGGWIELTESIIEGPDEQSSYTLVVKNGDTEIKAGELRALKLDAEEQQLLNIEIEIDESAARTAGSVEGELRFTSTSEIDQEQSEEFVFTFRSRVEPIVSTEAPDAGTLTGLLLLALLTPLLGLYAYNYFFGSRIDVVSSPVASISVRITGADVERINSTGDDRPEIYDADIKAWPQDEGLKKSVNVEGSDGQQIEISAHASRWFFRSPYARATGSGRDINIGPLGSDRKYRRARIPMSTPGLWVYTGDVPEEMLQEPASDPIRVSQGVIVVFPSQSPSVTHANELLRSALESVAAHMSAEEMPVQRDEAVTDSEPDSQYPASDGMTGSSSDDPTSSDGQLPQWWETPEPPSDEVPY